MLQRPFFTPIVIAFWSVTTGWLMVSKILPAWQPGLPPGQQALYASDSRMLPVAWSVACNDQPIGWALTRVTRSDRGGVFVDSRLHFDRLPWDEMLPGWATLLVRRVIPEDGAASFDARGRLAIDEEGSLKTFSSVANLPGTNQPLVLTGTVDDGTVTIHVVAGEMRYEVTRHLPTNLMIGDELSPQATMPGLTEGRRWTLPSYSPLRAGGAAIEILHAEVGGEETIYWEDQLIATHVVKYREDPSSDREPRARLWVDRTGRVLRQETSLLGAKVAFVRMPDDAAVRLAAAEGGAEAVTTGRAPFPSATAPEPSTP